MPKSRGNNRTPLQLRGKRVGEHLKARIANWNAKKWSDSPMAFHRPGSNKK